MDKTSQHTPASKLQPLYTRERLAKTSEEKARKAVKVTTNQESFQKIKSSSILDDYKTKLSNWLKSVFSSTSSPSESDYENYLIKKLQDHIEATIDMIGFETFQKNAEELITLAYAQIESQFYLEAERHLGIEAQIKEYLDTSYAATEIDILAKVFELNKEDRSPALQENWNTPYKDLDPHLKEEIKDAILLQVYEKNKSDIADQLNKGQLKSSSIKDKISKSLKEKFSSIVPTVQTEIKQLNANLLSYSEKLGGKDYEPHENNFYGDKVFAEEASKQLKLLPSYTLNPPEYLKRALPIRKKLQDLENFILDKEFEKVKEMYDEALMHYDAIYSNKGKKIKKGKKIEDANKDKETKIERLKLPALQLSIEEFKESLKGKNILEAINLLKRNVKEFKESLPPITSDTKLSPKVRTPKKKKEKFPFPF